MASRDPSLRPLIRLLAYARPYLWVVPLVIAFSFAYSAGMSGRAYLLAPVIDDVALPSASLSSLDELAEVGAASPKELEQQRARLSERIGENWRKLVIAGVLLVVLMPAFRVVRDYASDWLMTRLFVDLQSAIGTKLLRLPLRHHLSEGSGDFVARVSNDTAVASTAQALVFGDILHDFALGVTALFFAFWLNWQLTLVLLLIGPPIGGVLTIFGGRIRRSSRARQEQVSQVTQRLVQMLSGIKVIKAFHAEEQEHDAFARSVMRYFRRAMRVIRARVFSRSLVELVTQASFIAVLLVGVWAVLEGFWGLTVGRLAAFLAISAMLYRPLRSITKFYNGIQTALPAATRVFEILDAPETTADAPDAVEHSRIEKGVRYRNVSFSYGREPVLQGVDLDIGVGEVVALVGRTGSGKTTIADLLLRFYDPDAGSIEIDGIDMRQIKRASLHELVAIVTQDPFLFDDTILENIRYGRPNASIDEVLTAARSAFAHDFIHALPEGYDTPVGELGARLSGGQRQRITIARAILRDPQLLVFDEATSALDAEAEGRVQEAIANLMQGRTVLLIAHRLSTVKRADRIAVVQDGRIGMTGTHDELMQRGGLYRELVELQLTDGESSRV